MAEPAPARDGVSGHPPQRWEVLNVRLFRREKDEPAEVPCPNCQVLVAADAQECDVCGWDMRELPPRRPEPRDRPEPVR
jgi:hypothetical protein